MKPPSPTSALALIATAAALRLALLLRRLVRTAPPSATIGTPPIRVAPRTARTGCVYTHANWSGQICCGELPTSPSLRDGRRVGTDPAQAIPATKEQLIGPLLIGMIQWASSRLVAPHAT